MDSRVCDEGGPVSEALLNALLASIQHGFTPPPAWGLFERAGGAWLRVCPAVEPFDKLSLALYRSAAERRA